MSIYIKKIGYQEDLVYDFVCERCHCEWSADINETKPSGYGGWGENNRLMECPCCGHMTGNHNHRFIKINKTLRDRADEYLFVNELMEDAE